jgi:molybdate transport system regulatory protein
MRITLMKPTMRVVYKVWLDRGGKAFGDGPYDLLKGIEQTGSLHQAAGKMGMSYSKAWRLIQTMEKRLGFTLIERKIGGPSGGGSQITSKARTFIRRYEKFRAEVKELTERAYQKHFRSLRR